MISSAGGQRQFCEYIFIRFKQYYFDDVRECIVENITEQYQEHIEHEFNALCKLIIRHASAECKGKISKRWKQEISFEHLTEERQIPLYSRGQFEDGIESRHPLLLCGHTVILENERLTKALSLLERKKQEMVFLYFFKHYTYQEIAGYYGQAHSSVWSRMQTVMKQLKKEMEKQG